MNTNVTSDIILCNLTYFNYIKSHKSRKYVLNHVFLFPCVDPEGGTRGQSSLWKSGNEIILQQYVYVMDVSSVRPPPAMISKFPFTYLAIFAIVEIFFFFLIWVLRPFQEYFTYIEPIVNQRWGKTGVPGEKPPDLPVQYLAIVEIWFYIPVILRHAMKWCKLISLKLAQLLIT